MPRKNLKREKTKKNEPNSQNRSVLWLVGEAIHETRGISPYGDLGGTWTLWRGVILHDIPQKISFSNAQNSKTRTIDKNELCFHTSIIRKGISGDAAPHRNFEHPYRHRGASKIAKKGPKKGPKTLKDRKNEQETG